LLVDVVLLSFCLQTAINSRDASWGDAPGGSIGRLFYNE